MKTRFDLSFQPEKTRKAKGIRKEAGFIELESAKKYLDP
jgi:hypothetical protein